ncbi:hypothetical protein Tco_0777914 [Tanacetum coccineum]
MADSSSHKPSSPEITPKEEPITLEKPKSLNPFLLTDQVKFIFKEIAFTTNNEVALLYPSHSNSKYFIEVSTPTGGIRGDIDVPVDRKAPKHSSQIEEVPQGKNPGAKSGLRRKQSSKHTSESKTEAFKSKTGQSEKEMKSSSAKDKRPSHPSPPTPVVGEMRKEAQQVVGGPTSLGATSKEGAHPQLGSDFTTEADHMLQSIDREDLETLWKLVKAKHGLTRPEEGYERVLWGDLKVMFEPDVESKVWRNLHGHKVTVWKIFSLSRVHFVRFQNLHIFMLVEKKYPLTPATITEMLNKKLQADHWNEMCYQLLKLMTKQLKNPRSV